MPPKKAPKAVRYWPGRGGEEVVSDSDSNSEAEGQKPTAPVKQAVTSTAAHGGIANGTVYDYNANKALVAGDRRLRRLQRPVSSDEDSDEGEDAARRGRAQKKDQQQQPPQSSDNKDDDDDDESADEAAARARLRLRQRLAEKQSDDAIRTNEAASSNDNDDDESSEYETDSSDDDAARRTMLKPVFIPRQHRETIHERERREKEAEDAEAQRLADLELRKVESHNLVEEVLRKEVAAATVNDTIPDVDDTDGLNEEEEFELWRLRELMRIKRDRIERDADEKVLADIERRRNMTDAEIQAEDEKLKGNSEEKGSYKFMQKYYHKGAFFTDEEIVQKRDFNVPTLEDKFDKSILPAVMQVKNFGRSGQTKWTHLTKEDTSSKDSAWFQNSDVNKRTLAKMGGMKQSYEKPTASRKKSKHE
ncbi:hypothetical protein HDU98_001416 [Podochytrium sp. JEL0797]|nr:hypothetical protein HDU98_001416 [Podochytrium sp. JEL0797]